MYTNMIELMIWLFVIGGIYKFLTEFVQLGYTLIVQIMIEIGICTFKSIPKGLKWILDKSWKH